MQVIPAIDIKDGRCVRLLQGRFDQVTVYSDDPVEVACRWRDEGADRLHVVDLDGARAGTSTNLGLISQIAERSGLRVQVGGGIRTLESARAVLATGVERVIVGTAAALDEDVVARIFGELGDRVVLGVDARDGKVAVHGWEQVLDLDAVQFALRMQEVGARRVVFTDIGRDGMLSGLNTERLREMINALRVPVTASGGVSTVDDVRAAREAGAEAVIIGKALYAGTISLREAMEAAGCLRSV
ncbi:MAG: 1-(5-phosphoribosyl)-5-[(5-phosphoribosylamino)methylideneamino]imidazole-4-carboxamide isomerase [Armatimonadota bacterium]